MRIRIKHFRQSDDNQQFTGNASFLGGSPWGPRLSVTCLKLIFRWSSRETSVPDQVRGQLVTAYIVPKDGSLTVSELDAFCKESPYIANFKRRRESSLFLRMIHFGYGMKHPLMDGRTFGRLPSETEGGI